MNETNRDVLASPVRVSRIIFLVLLGSQAVYGWLAGRLSQTTELVPLSEALGGMMGKMLLMYAMIALGVSFFLPNFLVRAAFTRATREGRKLDIKQFSQTMFTSMIIALALREAVGMIGLVSTQMLKSVEMAYLIMPIAAIAMLFSWPSEERWAQTYEAHSQK